MTGTYRQIMITALALILPVAASLAEQEDYQQLLDRSKQNRLLLWHTNIEAPPMNSVDPKLTNAAARLSEIELTKLAVLQKNKPAEAPKPQVKAKEKAEPAKVKLPAKVLAQLKTAAPADVLDKIALGDALFNTDHLDEAYSVYKYALDETEGEDDNAWLLFQMANCRFETDPDSAGELYNQLLQSQPEGIFSAAAKVQVELIAWRKNHEPRKLLTLANEKANVK